MTRFLAVLAALALTGCATQPLVPPGPQSVVMLIKFPKQKQLERVVIDLYEADAPQTTANFKELVARKFYNGMRFHRAFPRTLVQTGDPRSRFGETDQSGTGGPGYTVPAEIRRKHVVGAVAAARLPDAINPTKASNGSQFYVCLVPMPNLDGQYTVFGQVVEGLAVLEAVSQRPTDSNDFPLEKIVIKRMVLEPQGSTGQSP